MTYATLANLTDRYGEDVILAYTDRGNPPTGEIGTAVVARALADADALIDSYIARQYELPLAAVPAALVAFAAQIAFYLLSRDRPSDEARRDHEDAMRWLRDVAAGHAKLDVGGQEPVTVSDGLGTSGPGRVFRRESLEGF